MPKWMASTWFMLISGANCLTVLPMKSSLARVHITEICIPKRLLYRGMAFSLLSSLYTIVSFTQCLKFRLDRLTNNFF